MHPHTGDGIRPAPNRNLIIMYLNMCIPQSSLEVDLNAMEMSKSQALQIAAAQKCTMREQLLDEMAGYKVKCCCPNHACIPGCASVQ